MKYIFTILSILFLPILSLKGIKPKLCINCKYFINDGVIGSKFGKCLFFPRKENDIYSLVNGNPNENIDYNFCSIARELEYKCGIEGKMYKKKYTKKNTVNEKNL
jgi:hypothetical protein